LTKKFEFANIQTVSAPNGTLSKLTASFPRVKLAVFFICL